MNNGFIDKQDIVIKKTTHNSFLKTSNSYFCNSNIFIINL